MDRVDLTDRTKPDRFIRIGDSVAESELLVLNNSQTSTVNIAPDTRIQPLHSIPIARSGSSSIINESETVVVREIFPPSIEIPYYLETFFFDEIAYPYIPEKIQRLLSKPSLTERERVALMSSLAQRAIEHFKPDAGTFLAINTSGQIVEVASTKIELLKRIQRITASQSMFLWRVGSDSFSGRF